MMRVRLPAGLKTLLASAAKANNRSMNAEIVARLTSSLEDTDRLSEATTRLIEITGQLDAVLSRLSLTGPAAIDDKGKPIAQAKKRAP